VRRIVLVLAAAGAGIVALTIVLVLAFPSTVSFHARTAVVLAHTLELPGAEWAVARFTPEPRLVERTIDGVPTTVAHPGGEAVGSTLVFLNGATAQGRRHPTVRRLASTLARFGTTVYVPDVHGLRRGEVTERTVADSKAVARVAADESGGGRTALGGVSVGTTLALLVAADAELAARVPIVAGLAPYGDMAEVIRLATTGYYRGAGELHAYAADPFVGLVVARSVLAGIPALEGRDELQELAFETGWSDPDPLAPFRELDPESVPADVRPVLALLANRDPARFDELYDALPEEVLERMRRLSPIHFATAVEARVELASGPQDKYFPLAESEALLELIRDGRLTVAGLLGHTGPRIWRLDPLGFMRFHRFLARALAEVEG
jgi:pimeloyl-ACP methyl ester carboxylesterase